MDIEALRASVVESPTDAVAFEKLQNALLAEGRMPELKAVYDVVFPALKDSADKEKVLRVVDNAARLHAEEGVKFWLNAQLGIIFWKHLDNLDRAEVYFRRVQDAAGHAGGMVGEFYVEFYAKRDNWRRLEELFQKQGLEDVAIKRKLAEIAEERDKKDKALAFWQEVYNYDPADSAVFTRLKDLYVQAEKWHSLIELLKKRLAAVEGDAAAAVALHFEMVAIYKEHIKSEVKVISELQALLKLDAGNSAALDQLEQLYEGMKRWPDLVRVLQDRIDHASREQRLSLHGRIAQIMLERFSNANEAIKHYQAILELDPSSLEAIRKLKELYEQRKTWEPYVEVAQAEIRLSGASLEQRTAALIQLAALASERIRVPRIALGLWEQIRENDPTHPEALAQLEQLYERDKAYDKLADVVEARAEQASDDTTKIALLEKLGTVVSTRLKDEDRTAGVWQRLLDIKIGHPKALGELKKRFTDTRDWDALDALLRRHATIGDLIRAYEGQLKDEADASKIGLLRRIATLRREEGNTSKAVAALEQVLQLSPQNVEAARALIIDYEHSGEWTKLIGVYDVVLAATEDTKDLRPLLVAKARISETKLDDAETAFFSYVEAVKGEPADDALRAELDRLAGLSNNWELFAQVVEETLDSLPERSAALTSATLRVAAVRHQLGEHKSALSHYTRVLQVLDKGNAVALDAIERIYRETEQWDELIDILQQKLAAADIAPADEKALRFEIAAVWRDRLGEPDAAMGHYREMMERFPDDLRIYDELAQLHHLAGDHGELVQVLEKKLSALSDRSDTTPAALAELQCRLGAEYFELHDTGRAVEYYIDALSADPNNETAVTRLVALLADPGHQAVIALALEPVYVRRGDHGALAGVLETQLLHARPAEKAGLLDRLVGIYRDKLKDDNKALDAASRLFELDPGGKARATVDALVKRTGAYEHLADLYELNVERVDDLKVRLAIHDTIARTVYEHGSDYVRAEFHYRAILDIEPAHVATLDALLELYTNTSQYEHLLEIVRKKESLATTNAERIAFRFQTAGLLSDQLDRVPEAIDDLREILALEAGNAVALARLDDLYTRTAAWLDLHDILEARIEGAASDEERVRFLIRRAELQELRLESPADAVITYAEVLGVDVVQPEAVAALQRLFDDPDHAPLIAPILEATYQATDDWEGLVSVYTVMEAGTEDLAEKVAYHEKIARLYEGPGASAPHAYSHWGEAYRIAPASEATVAELLRLADLLGEHKSLTELLKEKVDDVGEPTRRRELHRTIARLLADKVKDVKGAIEAYRLVLDISSDDVPATDALVGLYRKSDAWVELVETLRHRASLASSVAEKKSILLEAGDIAANAIGADEAISVYESVLEVDAADVSALDALARLYEETEAWNNLCRVLTSKVELEKDLETKKAYARELAGVQETHLEDPAAAIETHRGILAWDEADLSTLAALEELFQKSERWLELLEILDRQIDLEPSTFAELSLRKATVWNEQIGDTGNAITVLASILAAQPSESKALTALEAIVVDSDEREAAFNVLQPVLASAGDWARIYGLWGTLIEHRDIPAARIQGFHERAGIAEQRLNDPRQAFEDHGKALAEDPDNTDSMAAVERLARANSFFESLVALLDACAKGHGDPSRALALRLRAAEILKDELSDYDRAIIAYRGVLEDDDQSAAALAALDDLYSATDAFPDLAGILTRRIDIAVNPAEKVELFFRLADVSEKRLGDTDQAFESFREVFFIDRTSDKVVAELERLMKAGIHRADIAELLEPLYLENQAWERLHTLLELRLEITPEPLDRLDLLRRLAELNLSSLAKPVDALHWYGEAFRLDPNDDGLLERMETLAGQTGEYTRLKEVLLAVAIGLDDGARKIALWHKAASVVLDRLKDKDQAERIYELVLHEDPSDLPALQALDRLYVAQDRWSELEVCLERQVDSVDFDDDKVTLLLRLGETLRDKLGRAEDATQAFVRVLDIHDTHATALQALNVLYRAAGDWASLYDIVRRQADVSSDDTIRLDHLRDLADLAENRLNQHDDALELWENVLSGAPNDLAALRNVERLHEAGGNHSGLADAYDRELRVLGGSDSDREAALYRALGQLQGGPLEDPYKAQEAWQNLLALVENDVEALQALVVIHDEGGNLEGLAKVLEQVVGSGKFDGAALLGFWEKLARLYTESLPNPEKAIWAWQQVREQNPKSLEAVEAHEQLFMDAARFDDVVATLTVKAALVPEGTATPVWLALGEIQQFQLANPTAAAVAYAKVLALEPSHMDASERLEGIYTEQARWQELAELLDGRVDFLPRADDKRDLYVRLAEIHEQKLSDLASASVYYQAAHRQKLGDLDVLGAFERVATATESWPDLHAEYVEALSAIDDDRDKVDVGLRDARLLRDQLSQPGDAIAQFRGVLELQPEHGEALLELSQLLELTSAWEDLVSILERRYDAARDSFDRGEIGLSIGAVLRDKIGDVDRAVEAYRRVLDLGVAEERTVEALEALFRQTERFEDLIDILDVKARSGLGSEIGIKLEIGHLKETKLSDIPGAIDIYESILSSDEANKPALERLIELYGDTNDMEKLTSVYERLLHTAESDEEQITYCEALAMLHREVHQNPEAAADYYFRVLTIDSKHTMALEALEELYTTLQRWEDLIEIYRRRLEQADDAATWASYKERAANLYAEKLSDTGSAIDAYQQLLDRVPGNRAALNALESLFRQDFLWERVQEVLAQKAEYAANSAERVSLLSDRARIVLEELSDPDTALEIARRAETEAPADATISGLLEAIYVRRGEWENVIEVLRKRGQHAGGDKGRASAEVSIAQLYEERLHDGEAAIRHYEKALEIEPNDLDTSERLAGLYVLAEDWIQAEALLGGIVKKAPKGWEDSRLARIQKHLGLSFENLLRGADALRAFEIAHRLAPDDLDIMKALGRAAESQGDYTLAEQVYTELIERVRHDAPESELVGIYKTLGQLAFKSGNSKKAREYLEKTVALQPGSGDALKNLMTLCEQQGYFQGVIEYGAELQGILTDPLEKFELQLRVGDTFLKHIKDADKAVDAYRSALDYQPKSKAAHFKIFQVLVDAERHDEAVEILDRLVGLEEDPKRKAQYLGAIGDIFREKKGDIEKAVDYYERALDQDTSLLKLFRNIDEVLTTAKNWRRLQQSYRAMFDRVKDDETQEQLQYKLLFNLGEVYRTRLSQFDRAKVVFEKALEIKPKDIKSLQILSELYEKDSQTEEALKVERRLLELEPGNVEHYRALKRLMLEVKDHDGAWVACAVLSLLGQANDREEQLYKQHAPKQIAEDASTPTTNIWADALFAKGEDLLLGRIFSIIYQGIGSQLTTKELKDFGLKKKGQINLEDKELLTHVFRHSARVLGLNPPPDVFHSPKVPGLQIAELIPPVLLAGDVVRQGQTDQELGFVIAKALTYFHQLHVAVVILPAETLEVLFNAAVKLFVPNYDVGGLDANPAFQELLGALNGMTPQLRSGLQRFVAEYVERGQKANLTRWLNQIELSANHAGLLLCNDPLVAGQIIKNEASRTLFQAPSRLATRDKLIDLAVYALSEEYLGLRKQLGLSIEA